VSFPHHVMQCVFVLVSGDMTEEKAYSHIALGLLPWEVFRSNRCFHS
jgi:hypothetical protein